MRRVVIAGGGVVALELLLALRALAGDRVELVVLAPEAKFVNRAMAVDRPAVIGRVGGLPLRRVTDELGAEWHRGRLARVDAQRRVAVTDGGRELGYDELVVAVGARAEPAWRSPDVLTYRDARDAADFGRLLRLLEAGKVTRVAFVEPEGPSWPLPLYELAFAAAAGNDAALTFVTPAPAPLAVFGTEASATVAGALREAGVQLELETVAAPSRPGRLHLAPGDRRLEVDRVVTIPPLTGPAIDGVPCDDAGFIPTDRHGRVLGVRDVYAAGDATTFPVKQGGLAAEQADAIAEVIAAAAGAPVFPRPFRPVLRGLLRMNGVPHYMRAPLTGGRATISQEPLWSPPNRVGGRYLAPYLSRIGGAGVMWEQGTADGAADELVDLSQ
jgi:sulfide:quinone oxidoreductase